MSSFYSQDELQQLGFNLIGVNVSISRKASLYGISRMNIGDNTRIDDFCVISAGEGGIVMGRNVHIASHVNIVGKERITICDFAGVSAHSSVYSSSDDYSGAYMSNPTVPEKYKNVDNREIYIGRHSLVGAHSCILPGVSIGDNTAIGAFSLVLKDIPANSIAVGAPCKVIKERKQNLLDLEKEYLS